jgi:V8-like Glu-specific endopeptidase
MLLAFVLGAAPAPAGGGPAAVAACSGQAAPARVEAGKVIDFSGSLPSQVADGWSETYSFPGAKFLRLHLQGLNLKDGDRLVISAPDGSQAAEYSGRGANGNGDFWSFAVLGDAVRVSLLAPSGKTYSLKISEVGYGTVDLDKAEPAPVPEVVCDSDGREDIACHLDDPVVNAAQRPVARLLFTVRKVQYLCTGELIRGANANTMITNAHCIDSQTVVSTLEARFNYQYTACGGATLATTTSFAGGTWLKTNAERYNARKPGTGLDYTLLTLQGTPEAIFGELIPTTLSAPVGTLISFIQHPAGLPKKIGYWDDAEHTDRCNIATINMTYGSSKPNSQTGYACDSEGGSSGSAITRASDGKVVALHHYGGVDADPCLNSGTHMSLICQDAGSLLICDSQ